MTPRRPALAAPLPLLGLGLLALVIGACSPNTPSIVASSPTAAPTSASSLVAASVPPSPTPTPITGTTTCNPTSLSAQITAWDAGAGHRNATVTLTNGGAIECTIHALAKPQLVGGDGTVLIDGELPASSSTLTLAPGATVTTMTSASNYCGAAPVAPVTVAFVFPSGEGTVTAAPLNPTDTSGVPPCNGPSQPGLMEMQPFAP